MKWGINLIANGRNVGKHAARIAMLSSRYDQVAASVLFHVGSVTFVAVLSAERRTIEMMQVLELLVSYVAGLEELQKTYKKPRPKMDMSMIFCRLGSCKDLIIGRGRTQVPKSVAMLIAAGA
jgi:hypothetical protein